MPKDELPDDLVEFLQSDRRLEYDASACEIGVFTLRSLEEVEEIDLTVCCKDQESTRVVHALDLLRSCEEYDPRGILVYIPSLRKYGSYDSEGQVLITYRGMSWSNFLADPARYVNAAWHLDTEIAEATFADRATDRIVDVYSAANSMEANSLCEKLDEKGISSQIVGEDLGGAAGGLPLGTVIAPRIWVREGDAGRAREIIEEWTSQPRQDWSRPAECAEVAESDAQNEVEMEAELEPESEEELEDEIGEEPEEEDTAIASDIRFGWFSPVSMLAAACILGGVLWAALNWITIREYPAMAEGRLVEHRMHFHTTRLPGDENLLLPHPRFAGSIRYDLQYAFVVDGKTYYARVHDGNLGNTQTLIHYDPRQPEKNFAGPLTPPWIILLWTLGIGGLLAYFGYRFGTRTPSVAASSTIPL